MARKKSLVTGGAGFIGSHLVDYLLGAGASVRVLDNLATGKLENLAQHSGRSEFEFREGSILDRNTVRRAMSDVSVVFHLACLGVAIRSGSRKKTTGLMRKEP